MPIRNKDLKAFRDKRETTTTAMTPKPTELPAYEAVTYTARMYLQLPLRQLGAGNIYLLVLSS